MGVVDPVPVGQHLVALPDLPEVGGMHCDQAERAGMAGVDVGPHVRPTRCDRAGERAVSASDNEVQVGLRQEHPFRVLKHPVRHIEAVDQSPGDVAKQWLAFSRRRVVRRHRTARFEVIATANAMPPRTP